MIRDILIQCAAYAATVIISALVLVGILVALRDCDATAEQVVALAVVISASIAWCLSSISFMLVNR
jgi:hypothetical protein